MSFKAVFAVVFAAVAVNAAPATFFGDGTAPPELGLALSEYDN